MIERRLNTLVIGSGAAGLACACRLHALGVRDIAIYTDSLSRGTSLNAGSDKQTYYKLGMYGAEADSPRQMASDLMAGGAMHGDIALVEAAMSVPAFMHLVDIGVAFPHDEFGQYIGYKTDHDPRRRATSCGPYTSRDMCRALTQEVRMRGIEVVEDRIVVKILRDGDRAVGAVFFGSGEFTSVLAENVVFAVGGPGGMYETSVYPTNHTGSIGVALAAGAMARNLSESQFGLASIKFRWNVSGSYMQVLPRFFSVDAQGVEREFLREYFPSSGAACDMVFLKGYQWPFAASHLPGSSLIDIFTYIETVERGRRVYLDYRQNPKDFCWQELSTETREYLEKSNAMGETPLERLRQLNAPAIELYRQHGIDLSAEPLEIAVCAQHCNGGLAADCHWESVNLRNFFPIGEVNGSHGITRPGGSALNAGQVGAWRAAETIARRPNTPVDFPSAEKLAEDACQEYTARRSRQARFVPQSERHTLQHRMTAAGSFIRREESVLQALSDAQTQYSALKADGLGSLDASAAKLALGNEQLCLAQIFYLKSILWQIRNAGSRGGSVVLSPEGQQIHPCFNDQWRMMPERPAMRQFVSEIGGVPESAQVHVEPCHPLPETDGWFETVWREYRATLPKD